MENLSESLIEHHAYGTLAIPNNASRALCLITTAYYYNNNNNNNNNYSIILSVSDAVMIPTISDFFETRMHFEYLISGTRTFAGVS